MFTHIHIHVVTYFNYKIYQFQITLSDEQYQLLKRKGWILLEINDKVFLLDTLGLHDITADESMYFIYNIN